MKTKINPKLTIIILLSIFLVGCTNSIATTVPTPKQNECIPPEAVFAFSVNEITDFRSKQIPPPSDWVIQAAFPEAYSSSGQVPVYFKGDLWVIGGGNGAEAILRYHPETHAWTKYTTNGDREILFQSLLVSPDGMLWGISISPNTFAEPSALSFYNESTDKFEYVVDKDKFLSKGFRIIGGVVASKDGHLWITGEHGLYEYTPSSSQIKIRMPEPDGSRFSNLAIAANGNIWVKDGGKNEIVRFSPPTSDISVLKVPRFLLESNFQRDGVDLPIQNMYFDRKGNLWVDDRGWLDLASPPPVEGGPIWYQIVRSPVFIDHAYAPDSKYTWGRPYSIYESSNGLFWFSSPAGLVRLTPQTGEWCRLATGGTVTEDNDQNLWLVYDSQIYKYKLKP